MPPRSPISLVCIRSVNATGTSRVLVRLQAKVSTKGLTGFPAILRTRHKWGETESCFFSSKSFCETYTELAPFHLSFVFADNNRNDVSLSVLEEKNIVLMKSACLICISFYRLHFVVSSRGMHYQVCNSTCKCIYLLSFHCPFVFKRFDYRLICLSL